MATETKAVEGNASGQEWIKDIMPKGSRLIAHIAATDPILGKGPNRYAVFQGNREGLILYSFIDGMYPQKVDKPRVALKSILERTPSQEILTSLSEDELSALYNDEALAQEEKDKAKQRKRIPARLEAIRDELEDIQNWNKLEDPKPQDPVYVSYLLASIADICTGMTVNLLSSM